MNNQYEFNPLTPKPENTRLSLSKFDLSHTVKFDGDMGYLYPIAMEDVIPGDNFILNEKHVIKSHPLVAPVLEGIKLRTFSFFVPYRILDENWEKFITRGKDGNYVGTLPIWEPPTGGYTQDSNNLWVAMGFPADIKPHVDNCPIDYPRQAYNTIYNEWFRDVNIQDEVDLDNDLVLKRNWERDYFTTARPWRQRGTAPALPVAGSMGVTASFRTGAGTGSPGSQVIATNNYLATLAWNNPNWSVTDTDQNAADTFKNNYTVGPFTSTDIAQLRLAFQLQYWLERSARAGSRYVDFLKTHYGTSPNDDRLDRPEYIGKTEDQIFGTEIQANIDQTLKPQGHRTSNLDAVGGGRIGNYSVKEHGIIMTLAVIYPQGSYSQGIQRQWVKRSTFDFYFPEFALLSDQEILRRELYLQDETTDTDGALGKTVFGYQGRWDELRYRTNRFFGSLNGNLNHWHVGRLFATAPLLSTEFLECEPRKDIMAVPSEKAFIFAFYLEIKAFRPLPTQSMPAPLFSIEDLDAQIDVNNNFQG